MSPTSSAADVAIRLPRVEHGHPGGTPVVLLHGLSDSWRSFEPVLPYLPPAIHAIAVSLRGHGTAPRPPGGYGVIQLAGDVIGLLDELGLARAVVVGHSMGSIVAARLALDEPERVAGLVLMGAKPTFRALDALYADIAAFPDGDVDAGWVHGFQAGTLARPVPPGLLDVVVAESLRVPGRVWKALVEPTLRVDHSRRLHAIAAPTLVAWGDRDEIATRADQDELLRSIPDSRLVVYPGGGHGFHWEDPAAFAADLTAFVQGEPR